MDSLEVTNLDRLCIEAVETGVVPQDVIKNLDSMDWENVPRPRGIRYLLMHVYRSIQNEYRAKSRLYEHWVRLLHKYIPSTDHVLDQSIILERHIPMLTELLAGSAHKWVHISLALGLPESVRDDLHKMQAGGPDCNLCFY